MTKPIAIDKKERLFSHSPGVLVPLPTSLRVAQVFPALFRLYDLSGPTLELLEEKELFVKGPVNEFTVQLEAKTSVVSFWGKGEEGFFRYFVGPDGAFQPTKSAPSRSSERLFLGSYKKGDIAGITKRLDVAEIFPWWFTLGKLVAPIAATELSGEMCALLHAIKEAIDKRETNHVVSRFMSLFQAGFSGLFTPRWQDEEHQGIVPKGGSIPSVSPFYLLAQGASLIRSLLVQQHEKALSLLPLLPSKLHTGKMTNVHCHHLGELAFEWSKHKLRRVTFTASVSGELNLVLPPSIRRFRIRENIKQRGYTHEAGVPLVLKAKSAYLLDRFEK